MAAKAFIALLTVLSYSTVQAVKRANAAAAGWPECTLRNLTINWPTL